MDNFYAKTVFFVTDADKALSYYTNTLGFTLDWSHEEQGKPLVVQVSLHGFELILNQVEPGTEGRPGHGRVFIGLNEDQSIRFRQYLREKGIQTSLRQWGAPTIAINDMDGNEIFFWLPEKERAHLGFSA
jgi:catechol 2,3-dioxygenase-like lactoylglutathione lyase family enzyme